MMRRLEAAVVAFPAGLLGRTALAACAGISMLATLAHPARAQDGERGKLVYEQWCSQCHGLQGDGTGPAAQRMLTRPRDFTRGLFQIRTTAGGEIPTDEDILHVINVGMPGTTMPAWEALLPEGDRQALVAYVKSFYPPFATLPAPVPLTLSSGGRASDDRIAEGRLFYDSIQCWQCHGQAGRGDGPGAAELDDEWGNPIRAADLTQSWMFNGGSTADDIYRRLRTGLDGTPMPSFSDLLNAGFMTDDQLWSLSHYVRSLSPADPPQVQEVIQVERAARFVEVPRLASDERWDEVEAFYVPLVGQIITGDRAFDPAVTSVWVQGIHDGTELAIRVTWSDRSKSPDPTWQQLWQPRVLAALEPKGLGREPGARPDRLSIQFPAVIPEGMDRPYFLMGDSDTPVNLWQWRSDQTRPQRATGRGVNDITTTGPGILTSDAQWVNGQWQVVFRRDFEPNNAETELRFELGRPVPMAFFVWDGDSGEDGTRGAISTWYFLNLEEETPVSTYIAPFLAFLITGALGLLAITRARRRDRESAIGGTPAAATAASTS
ncbi:MAG: c-type cytochrome [Gemmatimonadetes bacterium]|nr:c-type cytochrome [Gemmatimonadota bacterium]